MERELEIIQNMNILSLILVQICGINCAASASVLVVIVLVT